MRTARWNAYNFFSWVIFEKWAAGSFCDIRGFASISKHPVSLFLEQILNRTTWRADQTRDECLVHQIRHLIPSSNFLGSSCTYNAASRYQVSIPRKPVENASSRWWACRGCVSKVEAFTWKRSPRTIVDPDRQTGSSEIIFRENDERERPRLACRLCFIVIPRAKWNSDINSFN